MLKSIIPSADNPHHDEITDIINAIWRKSIVLTISRKT